MRCGAQGQGRQGPQGRQGRQGGGCGYWSIVQVVIEDVQDRGRLCREKPADKSRVSADKLESSAAGPSRT